MLQEKSKQKQTNKQKVLKVKIKKNKNKKSFQMTRSSVETGDPVTRSSPATPPAQAVVLHDCDSPPSDPRVKTPGVSVICLGPSRPQRSSEWLMSSVVH